jgi:signal transduction histidine kinase
MACLNISRLQSAEALTKSNTEPLPIADIIRSVAEKLRLKAEEKTITLYLQLEEKTQIIGDGDQMVQLMLLFGDNAIKYSQPGSKVKYESNSLPDGSFVITISDTGPGIPEADLPYIFERFYKVDKSHHMSMTKGAGLGLAIAKEIIRMHGAKVAVKSVMGQGTSFIITFPPDKVMHVS